VARHIHGPTPPLLGVNFGHLGYLTAVESSDLVPFFERVLTDEVPVEHRLRLGCEVPGWRDSPPALNDIVIQDAAGIRTLRLRVRIGDRIVGVFAADGIIAATPTGSTAYTLSVGGPVVHPGVEAMLFALVSPHTLSARPMVVSPRDPLTIEALEDRPVRVTIDGQEVRELSGSAPIRIHRHPRDIAVVVDPGRAFIDRLREKLSWGGTNHNL